jgi:predicted ABC-type ATPase
MRPTQPEAGPEVLLLAGPNGAGKTTSSRLVVPPGMDFVNADVVASRLVAAGHPLRGLDVAAGRVVVAEVRRLERERASFCVETNLAARGLVRSIRQWRAAGWQVRLAFVALLIPELALARVAERVEQGGHDVPEPVVRRRWQQGLWSFFGLYTDLVDSWSLTDNSGEQPVAVARELALEAPRVLDRDLWETYRRLGGSGPG